MKTGKTPARENITGLVLAGGRGTRMDGKDKGLLPFHGKPLFQHAVDRLASQTATLFISANRHPENYAQAGFPVIPDELPAFAGPLAGFAAGLAYCRTLYMVAIPCDSPFFPATLVFELGLALSRDGADIAIAVTGKTSPFTPQPVFCLMKQELLPRLKAFLQTGQRKIEAWHTTLKVARVHFADEDAFCNINTREELDALEKAGQNGNAKIL